MDQVTSHAFFEKTDWTTYAAHRLRSSPRSTPRSTQGTTTISPRSCTPELRCLGWIYIGKNVMTSDATGLLGAGVSESLIPCNEASVDEREKDREVWHPTI